MKKRSFTRRGVSKTSKLYPVNDVYQNKGSAVISFAAVIVIVIGLQMAKDLLVPFLVAAFLALITVRPMLWMQKNRVPSVLAALIIVSVIMSVLAVVGAIVGSSIAEFTAALPSYQARLDVIVQGAIDFFGRVFNGEEAFESLGDMLDPGWAMGLAATIFNSLKDVLTNFFLIIFDQFLSDNLYDDLHAARSIDCGNQNCCSVWPQHTVPEEATGVPGEPG